STTRTIHRSGWYRECAMPIRLGQAVVWPALTSGIPELLSRRRAWPCGAFFALMLISGCTVVHTEAGVIRAFGYTKVSVLPALFSSDANDVSTRSISLQATGAWVGPGAGVGYRRYTAIELTGACQIVVIAENSF